MFRLGEPLGMETVNLGIGSTTVHDFGTKPAPSRAAGHEYVTTDSGEARTVNVTKLDPPPSRVVCSTGPTTWGRRGTHPARRTRRSPSSRRATVRCCPGW